jgi:hypothetical protein
MVVLYSSGKNKSFLTVEILETMLDDPKIQQMVFPYAFVALTPKEI